VAIWTVTTYSQLCSLCVLNQLKSSLKVVQSEREAVGSAIAEADPSMAKDRIRDAEAEKDKILESISSVSEKNELLQSECKELRARNTAANKEMAKLALQSKSISLAVQKKSAEAQDQHDLLKTLDAGVQVRARVCCNRDFVFH
jgi:chromosome segregation ATPase